MSYGPLNDSYHGSASASRLSVRPFVEQGAGGDAGDLAEETAPIQAIRAQPLGDDEHPRRCGTRDSMVVSSHWVQLASRFAWQLGQS